MRIHTHLPAHVDITRKHLRWAPPVVATTTALLLLALDASGVWALGLVIAVYVATALLLGTVDHAVTTWRQWSRDRAIEKSIEAHPAGYGGPHGPVLLVRPRRHRHVTAPRAPSFPP